MLTLGSPGVQVTFLSQAAGRLLFVSLRSFVLGRIITRKRRRWAHRICCFRWLTCATDKISHLDGSIVWRLGGKRSDFVSDTAWTGQHGARVHSQNETHIVISMFDNARYHHSIPVTHETSRALFLTLHVTESPMRAETLLSIDQPDGKFNMARGNVQTLPDGGIFVCWVNECLLGEYTMDGKRLLQARLKADLST